MVATPTTVEERLQALEQKNAILEREIRERSESAAAAKAKDGASGDDREEKGFIIPVERWEFPAPNRRPRSGTAKLTAQYLSDAKQTGTDQFLIRRARIVLEGTVNKFVDFRLVPDFGVGTTVLYDATYVDIKARPWLKLRSGKV